ncbi:MAG: twin-arginine translocase subunit TatC [Planctomycetota bacterium]
MSDPGAARMTIAEHLDELRKRLLVSVVATVSAAIVCFWQRAWVMAFLRRPLDDVRATMPQFEVNIVQNKVFDGFLAAMKISFFSGLVIAAPIVLMQMWGFISAGLYRHERRAVKFYALPGFLLFLAGAALAYFFVMPYAIDFLLNFAHGEGFADESQLNINNYVTLIAFSMFAFGIMFQLPVVMVFLMRIGVVEPDSFAKYRRHAIVAAFALAMIMTPPDVVTQIALAASMAVLYEIAILLGRVVAEPRKEPDGS